LKDFGGGEGRADLVEKEGDCRVGGFKSPTFRVNRSHPRC